MRLLQANIEAHLSKFEADIRAAARAAGKRKARTWNPRVWLRDWLNKPTDAERKAVLGLRDRADATLSDLVALARELEAQPLPSPAAQCADSPGSGRPRGVAKLAEYVARHQLSDDHVEAICNAGIAAVCNLRPDIDAQIAGRQPEALPDAIDESLTHDQQLDWAANVLRFYAGRKSLTAQEFIGIFHAGVAAAFHARPEISAKLKGESG